jgi:hypothetical protein
MLPNRNKLVICFRDNKFFLLNDNRVIWEKYYDKFSDNKGISNSLSIYLSFLKDLHNCGLFPKTCLADFDV